MIKRLFLILAMLLPCVMVAQNAVDSWRIHPFFVGARLTNNIDTGNKVYYLSSGFLYCFDKDTQENETLNQTNYLNDVTVNNIYYDYGRKTLYIVYDNGNLDLILDNGQIVNMPEVKNAQVMQSKVANDITFDDKYAYMATEFGYVVIDESKHVIKESRIFNQSISSIAHVGHWLVLASNGNIVTGNDTHHYEAIAEYKNTGLYRQQATIYPIDDTHFFINSKNGLEVCTIDAEGNVAASTALNAQVTNLQPIKDGYIASVPAGKYYITTDAQGGNLAKVETDEQELVSKGGSDLWGLNSFGLHKVGDAVNYFRPNSIGIETNAFWTAYNTGENRLYLASTTDNSVLTNANHGAKTEVWAYGNDAWEDVTPPDVPLYNNGEDTYQGNYCPLFVPGTKNDYLLGTRTAGLLYVSDGKIKTNFYFDNMPRDDKYKASVCFDTNGNLFAVQSYKTKEHPVMVLPKAKLANPEAVTKADWVTYTVPNLEVTSFKRSSFVISSNNIKVYTSGDFQKPLVFWDDKGNIKNTTPTSRSYTLLYDQDGIKYEWNNIFCLAADKAGDVWMGTNLGVVSFNASKAFDNNFTINHIKVPRNDGTNLADYLLDGLQINCITVDEANRKWIGTNSEGVFLVSPDGTTVIKKFNTTNSPLPSNMIYTVCCDPNSNSVYVVTSKGVIEYFSDTTPGSDDYSHVYVYPNPVRPENTGLVTIAGLMENSLVKIADSAGNVVKQLKSVGGMATWDCCNEAGDRVSTGVYYVLASQNENDNGSSVVSKFVIVK